MERALMSNHVFISHSSADDGFVKDLRVLLERLGLPVWVDSRNLRGGHALMPEITLAIEQARLVIGVFSPRTINSTWVKDEIELAEEVAAKRKRDAYAVIPILLPGVEPSALSLWFKDAPLGVKVEPGPGGLIAAAPSLAAALGLELPDDLQTPAEVPAPRLAELRLRLTDPVIDTVDGKTRVKATALVRYEPADPAAREVESRRFAFIAPLGPIEADDLRWYLEDYFRWPVGLFAQRAREIERRLPEWGRGLYAAVMTPEAAREAVTAWRNAATNGERRFSVEVDSNLPDGSPAPREPAAREAACQLFALPWELIHDDRGYLFQGARPVGVHRRLPQRKHDPDKPVELPIRVLLVSPRPEDKLASYIDHRSSALPLVDALEGLGDLVELSVLAPPTLPALRRALDGAHRAGRPFHVIHFDGHGVYSREHGLGSLCFEDPDDVEQLRDRRSRTVPADELAGLVRDHCIPVMFLDACQTAHAEHDVAASVAGRVLEEGVASVVAMSHSVLMETARRFVGAFYSQLCQGATVGSSMLTGQKALADDRQRGQIPGAGPLSLDDWFVPVLYQQDHDHQLFRRLPGEAARRLLESIRRKSMGWLPDPPPHHFIGRSRELLVLERLLSRERYAVVIGSGGEGKTTLAVELARWLVRSYRIGRVAFVSVEYVQNARAAIDGIGRQLLPEGSDWSVAKFKDEKEALMHIERAVRDEPTLLIFDNVESILPDRSGQAPPAAMPFADLFALVEWFLGADGRTRVVFTSRERLQAPFDDEACAVSLGALSPGDALQLVAAVMRRAGLKPLAADPGETAEEIRELVDSVGCHARALTLLAAEVAGRGARATTANVQRLMTELERRHPDDRERSLFASVELSVRRLTPTTRELIRNLAVFHGGAHVMVLHIMLGGAADNFEPTVAILRELSAVGLGEDMGDSHLRLDPALPAYLLELVPPGEQTELRAHWADAMQYLVKYLVEQHSKDAGVSARLTVLELPNLLALIEWLRDEAAPEEAVEGAEAVERLLMRLNHPAALAHVVAVREAAEARLGDWGAARFLAASVEQLITAGDIRAAYVSAQKLLADSLRGGESAYPTAAYDLAIAHYTWARVLRMGGAAADALGSMAEAQTRFETLAASGVPEADQMAAVALSDRGLCLIDLGRFSEAASAYEEAIARYEKQHAVRHIAVAKGQLGTIYFYQGNFAAALASHRAAKDAFAALGEPGSVAAAWHNIGMVCRKAEQFDEATNAYTQALAIWVQLGDRAREAATLGELGNISQARGRLEDVVAFQRQAADKFAELHDLAGEGKARTNAGDALVKLGRFDDARRELDRAMACNGPFGQAATPWRTLMILHDLEEATGHPEAASSARKTAIALFLDYRRGGGENHASGADLVQLIAQAIQQNESAEAARYLAALAAKPAMPAALLPLFRKLQSILRGARDLALADDPSLYFRDAAELRLLLERLQQGSA
jgi:tetratricopeptide (TPR) repeat protein